MKTAKIDRRDVEKIFSELEKPVKLLFFFTESNCPHCPETREVLAELTDITRKIELETYNFKINKEKVAEFKVARVPAIVPVTDKDFGIRYYGAPTKMEFHYFLENLVDISRGKANIVETSRRRLQALGQPLHVQLFLHGECGFGIGTMQYLGRFAVESEKLSVDFIDPLAFPELTEKYDIKGVPFAVVNDAYKFYAAMSEDEFLQQLEKAGK